MAHMCSIPGFLALRNLAGPIRDCRGDISTALKEGQNHGAYQQCGMPDKSGESVFLNKEEYTVWPTKNAFTSSARVTLL